MRTEIRFNMKSDKMLDRLKGLFRRKRSYPIPEIIGIIRDVAPEHHVRCVILVTSSDDGLVGPDDELEIYAVNDGNMGYGDYGVFIYEINCRLDRDVRHFVMNSKTPQSEIDSLCGIIAYSR